MKNKYRYKNGNNNNRDQNRTIYKLLITFMNVKCNTRYSLIKRVYLYIVSVVEGGKGDERTEGGKKREMLRKRKE